MSQDSNADKVDKALTVLFVMFIVYIIIFSYINVPEKHKMTVDFGRVLEKQHITTHYIRVEDLLDKKRKLGCSSTAVGLHTLLTAGHCISVNAKEIYIDNGLHYIKWVIPDGADHVLVNADITFSSYSSVVERDPEHNEVVYMWGNPGEARDTFRAGKYLNTEYDSDYDLTFNKWILPTFAGDSGAGLFDMKGNVIAVSTAADTSANGYTLPLQFTKEQLKAVTMQ